MVADGSVPDWLAAERSFSDEVLEAATLSSLFEASARRHGTEPAQSYKGGAYDRSLAGDVVPEAPPGEYESITYAEMRGIVRRLAAGFRDLGVAPDDRVAIYADTRMEWALTDFALLGAGAVVTTVYTESSQRQVRYLLEDPGATGVVVEDEAALESVLAVADGLDLSFVVVMDECESDRADVYTLADLYHRGDAVFDSEAYERWVDDRGPEDLASVIYTSGTTGRAKGVPLTHGNLEANVEQVYRRLGPRPDRGPDVPTLSSDTTSVSFLPLAHVFERLAGHFVMFGLGATVGYAESPDTLAEDVQQIRPTTGASVPRVFERIYDRMRARASESPVKRRLFEWAVEVAKDWTWTDDPGPSLRARHAVADRLVYSKLRESLGGNLEFMVSGGGSLSAELCAAFVGMGVTVVEGYGLTETSPVVSVNPPEDVRTGTLGVPVHGVDVSLDESVTDPSQFEDVDGAVGELLVRGPNVVDGYWRDPDATERAFVDDPAADASAPDGDADRPWFRTGDLIELTGDGYLVYHDRIKELMVLSTGKNVAPQPIEDAFSTSERVDQILVVGDDRKYVGAVIRPNFERLRRWAREEGVDLPAEDAAACEDDRVREWIRTAVEEVNADLEPVERVKEFALVAREWTADDDLLTPSMKKKRRNIAETHAEAIESIYEETATVTTD